MQFVLGNALPLIPNLHDDVAIYHEDVDGDFGPRGGIFYGIGDEVVEYLLNLQWIYSQCRDAFVSLEAETNPFFLSHYGIEFDAMLHQIQKVRLHDIKV